MLPDLLKTAGSLDFCSMLCDLPIVLHTGVLLIQERRGNRRYERDEEKGASALVSAPSFRGAVYFQDRPWRLPII